MVIKLKKIGIICEYNPFHNGHLYHINKIKELYPDSMIILVMSGNFTERGEISLINKWDKTKIALNHNIDLVLELPFPFATESADTFANGAIRILSYFNVDYLIFGSECNDINVFKELTDIQLNNKEYNILVKDYLDLGFNYPTSMSKALSDLCGYKLNTPNDLLGLSYVKQISLQESNIIPKTIQRTNDYHSEELNDQITSATSIRKAKEENKDISNYVPSDVLEYLNNINYLKIKEKYFELLKYKIISEIDELDKYMDVSEGIEERIKKFILKSKNYDELIENIKTKRYTYNRLNRMFIHILTNYTKEKSKQFKIMNYIKVLGFNKKGSQLIKEIKKEDFIPIITNYSDLDDPMLDYELQVAFIYNMITLKEENNLVELKSITIKDEK